MGFAKRLAASPAVLALVAVLISVFAAQAVGSSVVDRLSLPAEPASVAERPWTPFTVMFVHDSVVHLVLMVLMLAAFGTLLHEAAQARDVLAVYVAGGLAGSLAALAMTASLGTDGTLVGASAAVLGVAAAVLVRQSSARVLGGTATQWLAMLVGINVLFLATQPLSAVAHLAGVAVGAAYGRWLVARSPSDQRERERHL